MDSWHWDELEARPKVQSVQIGGVEVQAGDRVRLLPRAGGDVMDIALDGKIAVIDVVEEDYDGKIHLAVVLDDDPGKDLGMLRQPGHRFFFSPDEVWPISAGERPEKKP